MISYETYCKIHQMKKGLFRASQIASVIGLDERTVHYWLDQSSYHQRKTGKRSSKLDAYKAQIIQWLEKYPYSGAQIFQKLKDIGYEGGFTIVTDYIRKVRPCKQKAFLTLSFAPGECAQVDWGQYGSIQIGSTRRRLSFFVMVLCYSRMMYVEFTVSEKMEHFLACHQHAFEFFGAVPHSIMIDNLKCAVIKRIIGQTPVFNRQYQDFATHYGFDIRPCNVGKGNEKGRVENSVKYIKNNFLAGLEITDFNALKPAAHQWVTTIANERIHGTTRKKPAELFEEEKNAMSHLPLHPFDTAKPHPVRVNNRFRIVVDTNRYSVPAEYAGSIVTLKAYADRLCVYSNANLIATHTRSYDRFKDYEHPDHPKELLTQRKQARDQKLFMRFLAISPRADEYYKELAKRRMNPRHHIRHIVALSEIYGTEKVKDALEDAFCFSAFSSEYIANIIEQRSRIVEEPQALHVTRRKDLLDVDVQNPDLNLYDQNTHGGIQ
jgi:transposase